MVLKTIEDTDIFLVIIDNFSNFGWAVPIKNKNAQTIKGSFGDILINSKRKPNLIETDRGKDFYNNIFQDFLNKSNIKLFSRNTSVGAVFAERFNRTIRDLHKKIVFEQSDAYWINILPTKKNNIIMKYILHKTISKRCFLKKE